MWKGHAPSQKYTWPWLRLQFWMTIERFACRRRFKAVIDLQRRKKGADDDRTTRIRQG